MSDDLARWRDQVLAELVNEHRPREATREALSLFTWLADRGVTRCADITGDLTMGWAQTSRRDAQRLVSINTISVRQLDAMGFYAIAARLGAAIDPRTAAGPRITMTHWDHPKIRPLTDAELLRVRDTTLSLTPGHVRTVGLSQAGGSPAEIAAVRLADLDLTARTVRFTARRARTCALDQWSADAIEASLRTHPIASHQRLCTDADMTPEETIMWVSNRLRVVIESAGISDRDGVAASSIRLAAGRAVLEQDGLEAAAAFLGVMTLDRAARMLHHRWDSDPCFRPDHNGDDDDD